MSDKNTRQDLSLWSGNPFADFRKQMDDLMEGFFGSGGTLAARSGLPSLDMTGAPQGFQSPHMRCDKFRC